MVTEAVLRYSRARIIGLCDQHAGDLAAVGAWAGIDPRRFHADWYGLNHATWTTRLVVGGHDVLSELHARVRETPDDRLPEGLMRYVFRLFRLFGALPNAYLRYYPWRRRWSAWRSRLQLSSSSAARPAGWPARVSD